MKRLSMVAEWRWLPIAAQLLAGCGAPSGGGEPGVGEESEEANVGEVQAAISKAPDCTWDEMNTILSPPTSAQDAVARVACNFTYPRNPQAYMKSGQTYPGEIRKAIEFRGSDAVGITFTCRGHRITGDSGVQGRAIRVVSAEGAVPHHIRIEDCEVHGNIGLGHGVSTICSDCADPGADAIARRQATAAHHIILKNLKITARSGGNGVHFEIGVTFSALINSRLQGSLGRNTAVYLSPESANNAIVGNFIAVNTENREQIAIDGSANNYVADNDLSALNHGGIFIFRNCGERGSVRIQKPWNNSIVNNRFYYQKFDMGAFGGNWDYPAIWVASRTSWYQDRLTGEGHLANLSGYCNEDSRYPFGSGIDDSDNAKNTLAAQNQVRKGEHGLSVAEMFRGPLPQDSGSQPFTRTGNSAVSELTKVPTKARGVAGEPSVLDSLYLVQGSRLWRTDDVSGISVALDSTDWTDATTMTARGDFLYVTQGDGLYEVEPATGKARRLSSDTWAGTSAMTTWGARLFIVQDETLWTVDDFSTGPAHPLSRRGTWAGATSMTALGDSLYIIQDQRLWRVNPTTGKYTVLGGPDWWGPTSMTSLSTPAALYIIQDGALWRVTDLTTGRFTRLGDSGAWAGATSMTSMNGSLYVIQDRTLWMVDPATGDYAPIERPHWDYSGPTVMAAVATPKVTRAVDVLARPYSRELKSSFAPFIP